MTIMQRNMFLLLLKIFFIAKTTRFTTAKNFPSRMWGVPSDITKPWQDQGAIKYLLTPGFRGRNETDALEDLKHVWDTPDNVFNSYPSNLILLEEAQHYRWTPGDWIIHFASCKFYSYCLDLVKFYHEYSLCNVTGVFDPPLPKPAKSTTTTTEIASASDGSDNSS